MQTEVPLKALPLRFFTTPGNHTPQRRFMTDRKLLRDARKGDSRAQYRLYRWCFPILMSVCSRYRNVEADAVAMLNEGFLKIVTKLDKYREDQPFEAWIKRIMINTLIDDFRKNRQVRELVEYHDFTDFNDHDQLTDLNTADLQFDAAELEAMIHSLPPMSRKVFNLYAIDGYSHKEVGKLLGISEGTSKWHLSFARKRLQDMLKTENEKKGHPVQEKIIK
ncbi:MAG: RNA polymerase subunit sigma-24 [Saprospirales bacterium]|nr:RNA polymerase subunit sigma-24 [Saprospirales bacterium]